MTDKMREEFESGVCDMLDLNKSWNEELGCYTHPKTDNYFVIFENGWLRSRDVLCVELPMEYKDQFNEPSYSAPAVIKAILDAGVSYK